MTLAPPRPSFAQDLRDVARLAFPIVGVQVGLMAMGVVDTMIVGHVSAAALAGVAIGNLYFFMVMVFGMGLLFALDPLVAQGLGAGDRQQVTLAIQRSLLIAAGMSVVAAVLYIPAGPVLGWLDQPKEVVPIAARFVHASIPGALPLLAFVALRQSLQAMKRTRPIVATIVGANVLNAALCAALVYGLGGFPAMGAVGAAWSSTVSRWILALALLALAWRDLEPHLVPWRREAFERGSIARMLGLGLPIAITVSLESGVFAVVALVMGRLGTAAVAGHQIAIRLASFTFMVPLGVGNAAAVLVGHAVGRGDLAGARRAAWASLTLGVGFMALSALVFITAPGLLSRLFTGAPDVLAVAIALLPIAGVFQVFDGIQVVAVGVLRGAGETRGPMIVNILGFWLLGFPVSLFLGFRVGLGPRGLWWGFVAGLAAVAILLVLRMRVRLRSPLERVRVDEARA